MLTSSDMFLEIKVSTLASDLYGFLDSGVLPFTSHVEDGERLSQSCSDEYDWFNPYLTQND